MPTSTPSTAPRRARPKPATLPSKSATGAIPAASTVAEVVCPAAPRANGAMRQTHGAVTPMQGSINNVNQLVNNGRSIIKGDPSSFATLSAYTHYLNGLSVVDLNRHAAEAKQVPIGDRPRLIRRLEVQWTATAARTGRSVIPTRPPFSQAQIDAQNEIRNKLLKI